MTRLSAQLSLGFSALGHAYMHFLAAFFFIIALALEEAWQVPYHELTEIWTLGALMIGLGALPAGWLGDRFSAPLLLAVMFVGMGAAAIYSGLADDPGQLLIGLTALGLFAAIYHPVGIPWVVRCAKARGKALGINGIFGGLGVAAAGGVTGFLVEQLGWRAATMVPGVVSVATGLALFFCLWRGLVADPKLQTSSETGRDRGEMRRAFALLLITMFCMGFIYQASQVAFPKVFDLRLTDLTGGSTAMVGVIISIVYAVAALMQFFGGHLADKLPLRAVYLTAFLIQVPVILLISTGTGLPLVVLATLAVMLGTGALPAENMLLSQNTPGKYQSLAFGLKFVIAFGVAPLAIWFASWINGVTGEFVWLFVVLAGLAGLAAFCAAFLPGGRAIPVRMPAPAE